MKDGTAPAFRRVLEDRLKVRAGGDGARIARDRKRVVFDRFLARLADVAAGEWVLKGGFALDLRLEDRARSTKDIDLAWQAEEDELLDVLIDAAVRDQGDFFTSPWSEPAILRSGLVALTGSGSRQAWPDARSRHSCSMSVRATVSLASRS